MSPYMQNGNVGVEWLPLIQIAYIQNEDKIIIIYSSGSFV